MVRNKLIRYTGELGYIRTDAWELERLCRYFKLKKVPKSYFAIPGKHRPMGKISDFALSYNGKWFYIKEVTVFIRSIRRE